MIDLGSSPIQIDDLTLFASAEKGVWYFLPVRPRLQRDANGKPGISLTKYRRDLHGEPGGALHVSADLSVSSEALERAAAQLRGTGAPPRLAPLPVQSIRCDLMAWHDGSHDQVGASANVDKVAPFAATLDARLTASVAMVFEAAWRLGQSPGNLMYWLLCPAQRPAIDGRMQIDGARVARFLSERLGPGVVQFDQIAAAIPDLQQQGLVRIELMGAADSLIDVTRANEALERIVITEMFTAVSPAAGAVAVESAAPERLALQTRQYQLKAEATRTLTFDLSVPAEVVVTLGSGATLAKLIEPFASEAAAGALVIETEDAPAS